MCSRNRPKSSPVKKMRTDMGSMYSSDLKSYTSACETDPNLQSFDSSLRERTNKLMRSVSARGQTQPIDSHKEVYEFLFQVNQDTVKFITRNRMDVKKNKDLTSLVDAYFKITVTILDFCNTVQNCVNKAEIIKLMIQLAVEQFDIEENSDDGDVNHKKHKYTKTLEALNKFTATEDPFNEDFSKQYKLVYEEQVLLVEKLHKLKKKHDKKLKNVKTWRILSNVVFATALVSVLVLSLVVAAHGLPDLVVHIASLTGPVKRAGKWFNEMCKEYEKEMKRERNVVESIEMGVRKMNVPMQNMRAEAEGLKSKIEFIINAVEFAKEKEDEAMVKLGMQDIKKKIEEFSGKIEQVGEAADKCGQCIASARLDVLEQITMLPTER